MRYHPYHAPVPSSVAQPTPAASPRLSRLMTWSGVAPLGAFLLVHAATNARVLWGDAAFARTAEAIGRVPAVRILEWVLVLAPLAFHVAVGLWLVATGREMAPPSPYPPSVRAAVRWTGVGTAAFLVLHLAELPARADDGAQTATVLAAALSATSSGVPWRALVYLAGVACVSFHAAASVWGAFASSRRGLSSERARRWAGWAAGAAGAGLCMVLGSIVVFYATGSRAFGTPERAGSTEPCPSPPEATTRPQPTSSAANGD